MAKPLPTTGHPWHETDAQCADLNVVLHEKCRRLYTVWNRQVERYEIWRDNPDGTRHMFRRLEDGNGGYLSPSWMKGFILAHLHAADQPVNDILRRCEENNARRLADLDRKATDEALDQADYYRRAVAIEESGQASPYAKELAEQFQQREAEDRERIRAELLRPADPAPSPFTLEDLR